MFIKDTVKSMSIFLGVFSVLLLFSVVLYDKYGGQVIVQKDGDRLNQSSSVWVSNQINILMNIIFQFNRCCRLLYLIRATKFRHFNVRLISIRTLWNILEMNGLNFFFELGFFVYHFACKIFYYLSTIECIVDSLIN